MTILIQNRQHTQRINLREFRKKARKILEILGLTKKELSILLTDDPTIAELNQRYLDRTGPTNVIAFPMHEGPYADINPHLLGDVVISTETAHRQAQEAGLTAHDMLDRLLVHGILHLVGYDHERSQEERHRMEQKEQEVIRALRDEEDPLNRGDVREVQ